MKLAHLALVLIFTTVSCRAANDLGTKLDAIATAAYKANEPGAAVLVVKNGTTLLRKGYGMADLEMSVPIAPDMPFRIGSITKQFTAIAILKLVEEGKLALDDNVSKHLPDYPTRGKVITIEHLLTHSSGIPSYTSLPSYWQQIRRDVTVDELILMTRDLPLEFEPGARYAYNNSGYILLGAIIEKVSGMKYADYLRTKLFEPAGMTATRYDSNEEIIPRRVRGYDGRDGRWRNAPYIAMSQPFSAGSLLSTVDDLAKWHEALFAGKIVKPELVARAHRSYVLAGGKPSRYGYGWSLRSYEGHPLIEHGGGINGFVSFASWMPDEKLFVAVLANSGREPIPDLVALQLIGAAIGKPFERKAIAMDAKSLDRYAGAYMLEDGRKQTIVRIGTTLILQIPAGPRLEIEPISEREFLAAGTTFSLRFDLDGNAVTGYTFDGPGPVQTAKRYVEPARTETKAEPQSLTRFNGRYELAPGFVLTITAEGDRLFAQATGQPRAEIFRETELKYFYKVVDAQITFNTDATGRVTGLVLHQNGREAPAQRVE